MGDVIPFKRTDFDLRAASRHLDEASRGAAASAKLLRETREQLQSAENYGRQALAKLDKCQELLVWTERFCDQCLAATDLPDVEEMVRQRDALAAARKRQEIVERAIKFRAAMPR